MSSSILGPLSGERFAVHYQLTGNERDAQATARAISFDQTVELPEDLVPPGIIRDHIVGQVEEFREIRPERYEAVISFAVELVGSDLSQLLNVVFGMSSLKSGIRVTHLELSEGILHDMQGPRLGQAGLRERLGVSHRPLLCGVLKPVGLTPPELANLAYQFALGGLDLIKDDQGLTNQSLCPFKERVAQCAEAVAKATRQTGRKCLYLANVTGSCDNLLQRSTFAKQVGAGGLLICPGITGFDALRRLAEDENFNLPVMSHPAFLGSFVSHPDSGISPSVLFGQFPRLAGADVSIYPIFGGPYVMSRDDCLRIAKACSEPFGPLKPIFPTAAGRMSAARVRDMSTLYGNDFVLIVGGELLRAGSDVVKICNQFVHLVSKLNG